MAPLSTIPSIYFDDDFHLENPRTFDVVSEKSEIVRQPVGKDAHDNEAAPAEGRKALAANAILQEKLSWYMDTVEIHLISSISTASTSFFDALKSLRELHSEAEESVKQITVLRGDLAKLDKDMAVGGLEIVAMKRKRDNLQRLGDAVRQLESIMSGFSMVEKQVEQGEIEDALDNLSRIEMLISGQEPITVGSQNEDRLIFHRGPLIDIRGLQALASAGDDIAYLKKRVGTILEAKFISTLLGDLRKHVDKVPANETFRRWDSASSRRRGQHARTPSGLQAPAYMDIDAQFRLELQGQLKALAKSDCIMQATSTYREAVQKEFKNLIRRHVPSSSDEDAESTTSIATTASRARTSQDRSAILARNLRALDEDDAESMFKGIYSNIGEALRRLGTQVKVLLDITSTLSAPAGVRSPGRSPMMSPRNSSMDVRLRDEQVPSSPGLIAQDEIQQVLDLSSLLGQAVDISQNQITKLLKVRTEQSTHLEMPYFLRYFTLNRLFADECEAVSGRSGLNLKTVVQEHIKSFVQIAGDNEKQSLVRKMDADLWDARDFGADQIEKLKLVTDASTKEIEAWSLATVIWSQEVKNSDHAATNGTGLGLNVPSINEPDVTSPPALTQTSTNGNTSPLERPSTPLAETAKAGKPTVRSAELDEQSFLLPSSALAALSGIITYLQLVTCIPALAPDIAISLLDFLRLFNSRSQQLILGAGATRSAGLKNITTKHLALSSQALSFVAALVPYVRECVRRYLPTAGAGSGVLADFDKVKRTLQEHQAGIVDKLVEIMSGRATAHVVSFKKIDWEAADSGNVGTYMETLVKETTMLQKVLSRHLSEGTVRGIMIQVMAGYRDVWSKAFAGVDVRSQDAKRRFVIRHTRCSHVQHADLFSDCAEMLSSSSLELAAWKLQATQVMQCSRLSKTRRLLEKMPLRLPHRRLTLKQAVRRHLQPRPKIPLKHKSPLRAMARKGRRTGTTPWKAKPNRYGCGQLHRDSREQSTTDTQLQSSSAHLAFLETT